MPIALFNRGKSILELVSMLACVSHSKKLQLSFLHHVKGWHLDKRSHFHQVDSLRQCKETVNDFAVQIMLEDDLVDTCKPGGRISVVGVFKAITPRASGQIGGLFKGVVVGNSVRQLSREANRDLTADDVRCACLPCSTTPALSSSH